ncbi:hypothetical protein [Heliophilum fasciatum]|uniref:Uncharacterized protein n=1 Tax=Heliophilum fasciatum TaxID=35700 RepID=A0A4R2RMH2_9FIRM|nr:hypothetical protein [Heliophilum fasciatum]MCW2278027.1 formate dehydrogenase maturation protein FdhE [Heliophilum fasciatum]TCP64353.1 hypothetical protein EDD73_11052 [Heliophilum fasciatum]
MTSSPQAKGSRKRKTAPDPLEAKVAHLDTPWREYYREILNRLEQRWATDKDDREARKPS